jgi:hypothetical protein
MSATVCFTLWAINGNAVQDDLATTKPQSNFAVGAAFELGRL